METNFGERRDHTRINIEAKAKYKKLDSGAERPNRDYEEVKIKNLGKRGVCIVTANELEKDSMISIELFLNKRKIKSFGEVVWTRQNGSPNTFESGINFVALKAEDIIFLEEFIEDKAIRRHDFFERE
jgi:hypothetical protein